LLRESFSQGIETFAVAFGIVLGGAVLGGTAELLTGHYPAQSMGLLADRLKIWAAAAALGGSLLNLKSLEAGLIGWKPALILREFGLLGLAFGGSFSAWWIIESVIAG